MNVDKLKAMFGSTVRRIWFARDCDELQDKVDERNQVAMKLEGAETKLIQTANGKRLKAEKKEGASGSANEEGHQSQYIDQKDRPVHKLKFLIGQKVDTIDWCRTELKRLIPEVDRMQRDDKAGNAKLQKLRFCRVRDTRGGSGCISESHSPQSPPHGTALRWHDPRRGDLEEPSHQMARARCSWNRHEYCCCADDRLLGYSSRLCRRYLERRQIDRNYPSVQLHQPDSKRHSWTGYRSPASCSTRRIDGPRTDLPQDLREDKG